MADTVEPSLSDLIARVDARVAAADPLTALAQAVEYAGQLSDLADALVGHYVDAARRAGASWAQIGDALGVSKQGAQQRFVPRRPLDPSDHSGGLFSRFTDRARHVVISAQSEARALKHNYIGTEHLLLALAADPGAISTQALQARGISGDDLRRTLSPALTPGRHKPSGHIPFTPRAKTALELAMREALKLGHNYIGTEHMLLAVAVEPDGLASTALQDLGADYDALRAEVTRLIAEVIEKRESG